MPISIAGPEPLPLPSFWYEGAGDYRLLGGTSLISSCEPHFHETYIIAYVKRGSTLVNARGRQFDLAPGAVLLTNPYEIVSCAGPGSFDYDVCYPSPPFMAEVGRIAGRPAGSVPRFATSVLTGEDAAEMGDILAAFCNSGGENAPSFASIEQELIRFVAAHPRFLADDSIARQNFGCVTRACELIEEWLEEPITINELSRQVRASRSYFVRSFRNATGLPPSDYIRQLRLARGLERIRDGLQLADVAMISGFADQAHFTREFKRIYGTTPGKLARDIARCRLNA